MVKITYLLGAGASANTIPVVADMHERMKEISGFLLGMKKKYGIPGISEEKQELNEEIAKNFSLLLSIQSELEWLIKEAGNFYTIDTLAKKFYLTSDNQNLARLKKCLIIYFTIEQYLFIPSKRKRGYNFRKEAVDKRYGSFIAAITKKIYLAGNNPDSQADDDFGFRLNPQINMLSWNYDMQFELSMKSMLTGTKVNHIKNAFSILPNHKTKSEVNNIHINSLSFSIVKLNGDASWEWATESDLLSKRSIFDGINPIDNNELLLSDFLRSYHYSNLVRNLDEDRNSLPEMSFNFAWESDPNYPSKYQGHSLNLEAADRIASETEILVVIGYSFPVFNREIDNRLIGKMTKLTKVYIQDQYPERIKSTMVNAFEIFQKTKLINKLTEESPIRGRELGKNDDYEKVPKIKIQTEDSLNQFVIPYELNQ